MINGVVGIKPTVGLTSRNGVIPISDSMDSVGTFGRTVLDAVRGLDVIVGRDPRDPRTMPGTSRISLNRCPNYEQYISTSTVLEGAEFGLPWKRCWELVSSDQKEVALKMFRAIGRAGAKITPTNFASADERIPKDGGWDW